MYLLTCLLSVCICKVCFCSKLRAPNVQASFMILDVVDIADFSPVLWLTFFWSPPYAKAVMHQLLWHFWNWLYFYSLRFFSIFCRCLWAIVFRIMVHSLIFLLNVFFSPMLISCSVGLSFLLLSLSTPKRYPSFSVSLSTLLLTVHPYISALCWFYKSAYEFSNLTLILMSPVSLSVWAIIILTQCN